MNVLIVSPLPPPSGGIATWTEGIRNYYQGGRDGVSIAVLNTSLTGRRAEVVSNQRNFWDEVKRTWTLLRAFRRMLREERPDVIHLNTAGAQFGMYRDWLMARAAHHAGVPVVVHFRCDVQNKAEFNHRAFRAFRWLVKKADRILVLNQASQDYVKRFTETPVDVVCNYSALWERDSVISVREKLRRVVYVGRVWENKGIHELLEAAAQLPDIEIHLFGREYGVFEKMEYPANVHRHGNVEHARVREELLASDVFVLPSHTEGFSNALVEAMAVGLPCVATDVGANAEMLSDGCGIVIPPFMPEKLVAAIEQLRDTSMRRELSAKVHDRYLQNYTIEAVTAKLASVWSRCCR